MKKVLVVNKDDIKPIHKNIHEPYEYMKYEVVKKSSKNRCQVSIFEIPPKKAGYPYHYHLRSEEVFYIISGNGMLETPDGNKKVSKGDVIFCPANKSGAHRLFNSSDNEMLVYIDFDTVSIPDVVRYPNTNKVGIIEENSAEFYFENDNAQYYDGE